MYTWELICKMSRGNHRQKDFNLDSAKEFFYRTQERESEKEHVDVWKIYQF